MCENGVLQPTIRRVLHGKMACTGVRVARSLKNNTFFSNLSGLLLNPSRNTAVLIKYRVLSSTPSEIENDRDPAPLFFNKEVQDLLKTLTRVDLKKVYRHRKDGEKLEPPVYKFMTDDELEAALNEAKVKAEVRLQMPPVVKKINDTPNILSHDRALQKHDTAKFVFTDITYGIPNVERFIVVRDPDGILRNADARERHRMNQIYFPLEGREVDVPKLFQENYLMDLLVREEYEFILDLACVQFEPNDPEYHRVTETVYSHVNNLKHFNHLRSTRHFGPLAFHLAWKGNVDNLIQENIQTSRLDDAVLVIQLYYKIHPTAKSAETKFEGDELKFIENFVANDANEPILLELAIKSYINLENAKREVNEGIKRAHGSD
ncbi:28S ribosomal protein S22, mitochondrial [Diprion similis]|uniref:28S ribosomal protein S22, mitochondrial n=1 Tax=Diprion similis TaxID=362088 RepID=UPI001EF92493|nr:28S ribosomal protein S22, mitochondrial [Diprion similis]